MGKLCQILQFFKSVHFCLFIPKTLDKLLFIESDVSFEFEFEKLNTSIIREAFQNNMFNERK